MKLEIVDVTAGIDSQKRTFVILMLFYRLIYAIKQ